MARARSRLAQGADVRAVGLRRRSRRLATSIAARPSFAARLLRLSRRPWKAGRRRARASSRRGHRRGGRSRPRSQQGRGVMPAGLVSGQERGRRRRLRRLDLEPYAVVSGSGDRGPDRPTAARRDVRHRARGDRLRGRRPRLGDATRASPATARRRRIERYGESARVGACAFVDEHGDAARGRPVRARGHRRAAR